VSVSGGADSSPWPAGRADDRMAARRVGRRDVHAMLGYIPGLAEAKTLRDRVRHLLYGVYQATRNSSQTTRQAATDLVEALGGIWPAWNRRPGAKLRGRDRNDPRAQAHLDRDDLACRTSKPGARAERVAAGNVKNALLLATSNRSERRGPTHDGRRHMRRTEPDRRHRQGVSAHVDPLAGDGGPEGVHPIPALEPSRG